MVGITFMVFITFMGDTVALQDVVTRRCKCHIRVYYLQSGSKISLTPPDTKHL